MWLLLLCGLIFSIVLTIIVQIDVWEMVNFVNGFRNFCLFDGVAIALDGVAVGVEVSSSWLFAAVDLLGICDPHHSNKDDHNWIKHLLQQQPTFKNF